MSIAADLRNVLARAASALDGQAGHDGTAAAQASLEDALAGVASDAEDYAVAVIASAFGGAPAPAGPAAAPAPAAAAAPAADEETPPAGAAAEALPEPSEALAEPSGIDAQPD